MNQYYHSNHYIIKYSFQYTRGGNYFDQRFRLTPFLDIFCLYFYLIGFEVISLPSNWNITMQCFSCFDFFGFKAEHLVLFFCFHLVYGDKLIRPSNKWPDQWSSKLKKSKKSWSGAELTQQDATDRKLRIKYIFDFEITQITDLLTESNRPY